MEVKDYKCPSCAASLIYNPEKAFWSCKYCFNNYTLEDLQVNEADFDDLDEYEALDVDEYTCSNCGAKIVTNENTSATFCAYCGGNAIIKNRLKGFLKPKSIIPFKITKEQAMDAIFKFCKKRPFAPSEFLKKSQIDRVVGIYIPFWLYDCSALGSIDGIANKKTVWCEDNYEYTKNEVFNIYRSGMSEFIKIPVDASSKFDDATMDSLEPFNYSDMVNFTPAYFAGFFADKYDVESGEAYTRAKNRVSNALEKYLLNNVDISQYNDINFNSSNINTYLEGFQYALLPVWILSIKYKNKIYLFAVNGQTGKMIGNVPISIIKVLIWTLGSFISIFTLILILLNLGGGL